MYKYGTFLGLVQTSMLSQMETRKIIKQQQQLTLTHKTKLIKESQDGRLSVIGSSIKMMKIMVRTKGVGTQSSRAVIQMGFLSSRTEIDFH